MASMSQPLLLPTFRSISARAGPSITALLLVGLWEACVRIMEVPMWLLPAPSRIITAAWNVREQLPAHVSATISATLTGFGCAVLIGVPLAALLVASNFARRLIGPLLAGLQAVPKNALAPIFVLWFGGGALSKIAITFLISFFPIVINTASGMTRVDRDMIYLTRTLKASALQTFLHVRLPNAVPAMLAGCKIAITLAIIGAVIGEFVASDVGLGYLILVASSQLQTDVAFVAILALALSGMSLFWCINLIERVVVPWVTPPTAEETNEFAG